MGKRKNRIHDVCTVSVHPQHGGVNVNGLGDNLTMTSHEARLLARALLKFADKAEKRDVKMYRRTELGM